MIFLSLFSLVKAKSGETPKPPATRQIVFEF